MWVGQNRITLPTEKLKKQQEYKTAQSTKYLWCELLIKVFHHLCRYASEIPSNFITILFLQVFLDCNDAPPAWLLTAKQTKNFSWSSTKLAELDNEKKSVLVFYFFLISIVFFSFQYLFSWAPKIEKTFVHCNIGKNLAILFILAMIVLVLSKP